MDRSSSLNCSIRVRRRLNALGLEEVSRTDLVLAPVNQIGCCGVLQHGSSGVPMHECAERLPGRLLTAEHELERDFEVRLADSSTLAFRVAFAVLRHHQDAEDVAQEALVKAYRSFRRLRDRTRFRAWLVRVSWRLAIDRQKANRRRGDRDRALADIAPAPSTVEDVEARERAARLWESIDALPEKLRVAIVLAGIQGHDIREVALLLGVPEGTVKSRLFLARQRLKERLQWTMKDIQR